MLRHYTGSCFAGKYLESFLAQNADAAVRNVHPGPGSWVGPPSGSIKLNFDGALLDGGSAMGIGVVARDLNGVCLAWLSRKVLRTGNGEIAEALAAREAIQLAARRGWKSIIIEGDCAVLISKLRAVDHDLSYIGTVIFDILRFVNLFTSCQFACVKRAFNSVAHCLAKSAVGMLEGVDDLPSSALDIVISEFC
ncbi:UNVERIFIED_CONTAM: hypothetical protein Sradi_5493600 [Sesamum radiatum]|uniref:RNase H type-1 domain-containing protein n=1 Tax=Sesamum radiatum TaxID=300843 RepID=A0AAW2LAK9_SESRA